MGKRELPNKDSLFSNETYNILKFIALVVLPALGTAYFGLSEIWGLPYATEVVGTLVVLDTFLGLLLNRSTKRYHDLREQAQEDLTDDEGFDGALVVDEHDPMKDTYTWEFNEHPVHLSKRDELRFKVVKVQPPQPHV